MELRPRIGDFLRPFGTAWFIVEFLKGNGPQDSTEIDPNIGATMTDIHFEYKSALHRAHAREAVEREEEKRVKRGNPAYTEEEYRERLFDDITPPAGRGAGRNLHPPAGSIISYLHLLILSYPWRLTFIS